MEVLKYEYLVDDIYLFSSQEVSFSRSGSSDHNFICESTVRDSTEKLKNKIKGELYELKEERSD